MSNAVTFLGHATTLIELDGVRLLTDPLLRRFVFHLRRQQPKPDLDLLTSDVVLISHLHGDHFDLPSLKLLGLDTLLVVPEGAIEYLRARGFRQVYGLRQDQSLKIKGVEIQATRAEHDQRRPPWIPAAEPLGYLFKGSQEIYFAGDTDLFPEMAGISPRLELALLPVWGWGPYLGKGHLDPSEAAKALVFLRPRVAIPIHWGTYGPIGIDRLYPTFLNAPPVRFARYAAEIAPQVEVRILKPGQSLILSDDDRND